MKSHCKVSGDTVFKNLEGRVGAQYERTTETARTASFKESYETLFFPTQEERWLNGSAPDCKSAVLGSKPAPPQQTANSVSPGMAQYRILASEGRQRYSIYTKKKLKIYRKKKFFPTHCVGHTLRLKKNFYVHFTWKRIQSRFFKF
jgi:hypothetical protein